MRSETSTGAPPRRTRFHLRFAAIAMLCAAVGLSLTPVAAATPSTTASPSVGTGGAGPDPGFGNNGIVSLGLGSPGEGLAVTALQKDGKVVVAFQTDSAGLKINLRRLQQNGALDTGFGTGGVVTIARPTAGSLVDVVVDPHGKIVVLAGMNFMTNDHPYPLVVRYNSNGTLDPTFGDEGTLEPTGADFLPTDLAALPDGRYAASGTIFPSTNPNSMAGPSAESDDSPTPAAVVLDGTGTPDPSFGEGGIWGVPGALFATAIEPGPNGTLLLLSGLAGGGATPPAMLSSLPLSGTNGATTATLPLLIGSDMAVDAAGRVLVAGTSPTYVGTLVRLPAGLPTTAGARRLDAGFGTGGSFTIDKGSGFASVVRSLDLRGNKIIGSASIAIDSAGNTGPVELFRLGADGALDTSIGDHGMLATTMTSPLLQYVLRSSTSVRPNGKVVVPGTDHSGTKGTFVGQFILDTPAPTPAVPDTGCPTGPVLVTPDNAAGAGIAMYVCRMHLVGTIWQGTPVLVVLPTGYFECPDPPVRHWYIRGFEFGYFLLQAQCGYTPTVAPTWFGNWFAWDPPV